jgi:hypothetical protein
MYTDCKAKTKNDVFFKGKVAQVQSFPNFYPFFLMRYDFMSKAKKACASIRMCTKNQKVMFIPMGSI